MNKKILSAIFVMLFGVVTFAQIINQVGTTTTIVHSGIGNPISSSSINIGSGKKRVLVAYYFFERDHRPGQQSGSGWEDNRPMPGASDAYLSPSPTVNNNPMTSRSNGYGDYKYTESQAYIRFSGYQQQFIYQIPDNLTGNVTFNHNITNAGTNAGDDVIIKVAVFENVSQKSFVDNYTTAFGVVYNANGGGNATPSNISSLSNTSAGVTTPVGALSSDVVRYGIVGSTREETFSISSTSQTSGWSILTTTSQVSSSGVTFQNGTDGANGGSAANSNIGLSISDEPDGIVMSDYLHRGANPGTFTINRANSKPVVFLRTHAITLLPLEKRQHTGNIYYDNNTNANVDGLSTGLPPTLYVNVVDKTTGKVVFAALVQANGTYTIPQGYIAEGISYELQLSTSQGVEGSNPPAAVLPIGWKNRGESTTTAGNDGVADGKLNFTPTYTVSSSTLNFGIYHTVEARNDGYSNPGITDTNGGVVGVVTANDMVHQQVITSPTTQVNITLLNNGGMNGATLNASGNLTIPPGTPAGVYILTYQICNQLEPTDCSTATITVNVYKDSDGDGYADVVDLDDDNDGILDTDEAAACASVTPFFVENFGTGQRTTTNYTNYTYMATAWDHNSGIGGEINDGFYAIVNNIDDTASWSRCAWQSTLQDHTPGDTNGRMAFFNATINPLEEFYNRNNISVPANTPVRLSFWAINVDKIDNTCSAGNVNRVLPNVRVLIKTNDGVTLIKAFSTGLIARDEQWHQYSFDFNPGNNTQIRFILMNDAEGGNGNDIAIDDIQIIKVCDTDGDGIPNDLDLDSDGDGCSDAIEGDEKLRSDHLLANGAIDVAANGGVGNLPSNLGVPNIVNSGTLDIGNDVGQGGGTAYNNAINPCLMDAIDDDFSANCVSSITGGTAGDVSANDLMYGLPVNDAWMTFTVTNNGGMTGVTIDANGNLIVPAGTPEGTYTITYQICKNNCDTAQVIVKVCRIYAVNDINQTPQGVSVNGNVITNDDSTNGALTVQSATYYNSSGVLTNLPLSTATTIYIPGGTTAAGTMTLNPNGTYTFVPSATFVGEVPVNYVATNGSGLTDAAILTIQVIPVTNPSTNDKPIAQDDTSFAEVGVAVTNNALANDSDPDANTLTITAAKQGANTITIGTSFTVAGTNPAGVAVANAGSITINQNGSYTYTPAAGFVGDVNPINYTISDGNSGIDTANIYITVKPNVGNTTFANDDANSAPKGTPMNGSVLTNDTDPEGNLPSVTGGVFFGGSNTTGVTLTLGTASPISGVGSVTLNGDGTYKFTPEANFVGTAEVVYTKCDNGSPQACDKATLYLTSLDVFDLQVCTDPNVIYSVGANGITPVNVSTGTTGTPFAVPPAGVGPNALGYSVVSKKFYYFESSNNPLTFVSFDPLTNVKTVLPSPYPLPHPGSTVPRGVVTSDGTGYYLLNEGVELYYYNIAANTWTLITNNLVDQNGNNITVIKDKEVSGDIAIDGQNNLWILSSAYGTNPSGATHSLFKISAPLPTTSVASLSTALLLSSAPNANSETFTGIAFNATGQIYLGTPNRIYRLNNDFTITQLANVSGASDLASCSLPLTAFPQDISGNVFNDANGLGGTPSNTIDGVGTNLGGTLNAVLIDRNNGKVVATVPVAANGTYSFPQTSAGIYTIQITTATATVGSNPPAVTLPAGWSNLGEKLGLGTGTDGTPDGKLNVDVSGAPVTNANFGVFKDIIDAVDDVNQTPQGIAVKGDILINDDSSNGVKVIESAQYYNVSGILTDLPINGLTDIYSNGVLAGSMLLKPDGTYTFTPTATFIGSVPITYTINNGASVKDKATLEIQVIPPANSVQNDNPVAINDVSRTEMNTPVSGNALANDSDPDGNTLTVSGISFGGTSVTPGTSFTVSGVNAAGATVSNAGSVTLNSNGTYTYTPATGFVGTVNPITYTANDGNGGTDTAFIYLTVNPELGNTTYANDDANSALKGTTMNGNVTTNDSDPENNQTTVTAGTFNGTALTIDSPTTIAGVGTVTLRADGTYTYVPDPNFVGTAQVVYTKCDNGTPQACDTATLYLTTIDTVAGYCYKFPTTNTGVNVPTKHGITALSRAGEANGNWPMVRQSSWTTLEAKTKGFVVNRVEFDTTGKPVGISTANYVEGMMVYDTTNNCLKIYNGTVWSCYSTPACP